MLEGIVFDDNIVNKRNINKHKYCRPKIYFRRRRDSAYARKFHSDMNRSSMLNFLNLNVFVLL